MPWRPALAASSKAVTSVSLRKSFRRSCASTAVAALFTLRLLGGGAVRIRTPRIVTGGRIALLTKDGFCKELMGRCRPNPADEFSPHDGR